MHGTVNHRRSIRLKDWDYSCVGMYFVTICAQNRVCLFGDVANGKMVLNDAGRLVKKWWLELNHKFPTVQTDQFVVMPNHVHGIIALVGADLRVCPDDDQSNTGKHIGLPLQYKPGAQEMNQGIHANRGAHTNEGKRTNAGAHTGAPLPRVIQWFKTMTTNEYIRGVKQLGWPRFDGHLWQRNYYEHIVRNEGGLSQIREYIVNNPLKWESDRENPNAKSIGSAPEAVCLG